MRKRWAIVAIYIVVILIISSLFVFRGMKEKQILLRELERSHLIIDDQIYEGTDLYVKENEKLYLKVGTLKDLIFDDFRISTSGLRILTSVREKNIKLEDQYLTDFVFDSGVDLNFPIKRVNDMDYIDLEKFAGVVGFDYKYAPLSEALLIDTKEYDPIYGTVMEENTKLHQLASRKSYSFKKMGKGEKVKIYKEKGDWLKIRTSDGLIGYVLKKSIFDYVKEVSVLESISSVREPFEKYKKINVTWDHIPSYNENPNLLDEPKIAGLDVLSPTWFNLTENGIVINNADLKYVKDAHERGYQVWALFKNNFDPELTSIMLNDPNLRKKVIAQMVFYSAYYELDGINIDFENVYLKDKATMVAFVKELDFYTEKQKLVLSIDATVPWGSDQWSKFLDREKISKYVDYVMLMAYDEHWASSPVSGSVASIGWVEKGIAESLKLIPKEKLILGVPFYTRIWTEVKDGPNIKVSSKSIGMKNVDQFLSDKNEDLKWDEEAGQFLVQYSKDGKTYKIWLEEENSLKLKLKLIDTYDIAGVSSWRKGFENQEIWKLFETILKK